MENQKQSIEVADIFRAHEEKLLSTHTRCPNQVKAFRAITRCRTTELGGHKEQCDHCGHSRQAYNSCRNRHCPKCQFVKKAQWVDKLAGNLPEVKYFHLVFTIPDCLHKLFYINQKSAYSLLFKAAGNALKQCAANTRYLGADIGAVGILHTWGQTLVYHPHIHMIVPAGGLSEDGEEWIPASKKFLLPVKVLSAVFRGKLCGLLEKAVTKAELTLPHDVGNFKPLKKLCYQKKWVVYSEKPFSGPESLLNYLGNYTHRVAISNSRIISHENGQVCFSYKDYKKGGLKRVITLDEQEFIRRFLQHVLPCGFSKIRYFGFMALGHLKTKLEACYEAIGKTNYLPRLEGLTGQEVFEQLTGKEPFRCPECKKGTMKMVVNEKPQLVPG